MRLGQGKDNSKLYLKENPEVREEIKAKILAQAKDLQGKLSFGGISGLDDDDDDDMPEDAYDE